MSQNMEGFMLLQDLPGEEKGNIITNLFSSKDCLVKRGELLFPIRDITPQKCGDKPPHNYRLAGDRNVTLYADEQAVSPLTPKEFDMLEGIKLPHDRYKVLTTEGWLEWGASLKLGSAAFVALEGIGGGPVTTELVVRFVGRIGDEPGVKFGVEIMNHAFRVRGGANDGTFKGKRYFACADNCGLFLGLDKLLRGKQRDYPPPTHPNTSATASSAQSHGGNSYANVVSSSSQTHGGGSRAPYNKKAASSASGGNGSYFAKFKPNDKAVAFTKAGESVTGTVVWCGKVNASEVVGILPDKKCYQVHQIEGAYVTPSDLRVKMPPGTIFVNAQCVAPVDSPPNNTVAATVEKESAVREGKEASQRLAREMKLAEIHQAVPNDSLNFGHQAERLAEYNKEDSTTFTSGPTNKEPAFAFEKREMKMAEIHQAVPDDSLNVGHQAERLAEYNKEDSTTFTSGPTNKGPVQLNSRQQCAVYPCAASGGQHSDTYNLPKPSPSSAGQQQTAYLNAASDGHHRDAHNPPPPSSATDPRSGTPRDYNPHQLAVNSAVELLDTSPQQYGTIKWMGYLPRVWPLIAGVELEEDMEDCTDGTWEHTGKRYFTCPPRRAFFCTLDALKPDSRYQVDSNYGKVEELKKQLQQKNDELRQRDELLNQLQQQIAKEKLELQQQMRENRGNLALLAQVNEEKDRLQRQVEELTAQNADLTKRAEDLPESWVVSCNEVKVMKEKQLGYGAYGYVAQGVFRGQHVAVKQIHNALLDRRNIDRIHREIRTMATVRHPNLVLFIAAVLDNQAGPMIITELLDTSLREAYEKDRLGGNANLLKIFRDVASALSYLHRHHTPIIHRDVSSANVLLEAMANSRWKAKLSDFGSANLVKHAVTAGEGAIIYTAPEAYPIHPGVKSPPKQTPKVDVYSYGALVCEVITKELPDPEKLAATLAKVKKTWPQMHTIIKDCIEKDPEKRPMMSYILEQL